MSTSTFGKEVDDVPAKTSSADDGKSEILSFKL